MRLLGRAAVSFAIVIGCVAAAHAAPPCGNNPGDASMVASLSDAIAAQCGCCVPPGANVRCALGMIKPEMRAGRLSRTCARRLLRTTLRTCPPAADGSDCRICNADSDCAAGEFCDCRLASCGKTGGVCTTRPEVCSQIAAPVCGCDGMTYANDCERQSAGACKRHDGACMESGGCFDTSERTCTNEACSPASPCMLPNQICTPRCASSPPTGTCMDLLARTCTTRACGAGADCLPGETCVPACPPPLPAGKCVASANGECSDRACGPGRPCPTADQFCNPACLGSPGACTSDADCDDGNGCSADHCINGACEHACLCLGPQGESSCCPGPAALCVKPCSADPTQACGGACPPGATCMEAPGTDACACVSPLGGPCGGNVFVHTVCAPGLVCEQSHPDATGVCVDPQRPCADSTSCSGPCTRICADGTAVKGTCTADASTPLTCACSAECTPPPTPTAGPCGPVDTCGGPCPFACPDGTTVDGMCMVLVVDPPGSPNRPVGPTCLCLGDCPTPPTPTPGPCGSGLQCSGPCKLTCSDGSVVDGTCVPPPFADPANHPCACIATCGPPPPSPTPGPCDASPTCSGPCPFACPDGTATTGRCIGLPTAADKLGPHGPRMCACMADCGPPPTIGLPHGTICCQCGAPTTTCFEKHWVEVTPVCPTGCDTVVNGTCDATGSCVPPASCQTDQDCADGDACTVDRCVNGVCVRDCVCKNADGTCRPGPLVRPDFQRR